MKIDVLSLLKANSFYLFRSQKTFQYLSQIAALVCDHCLEACATSLFQSIFPILNQLITEEKSQKFMSHHC